MKKTTTPTPPIKRLALSDSDLAQIRQRRRDHNRLGYAYQLAFVRLLNRFPQLETEEIERNEEILTYISIQLGLPQQALDLYAKRKMTVSEHQEQIRQYLDLRRFTGPIISEVETFIFDAASRFVQGRALLAQLRAWLKTQHILEPAEATSIRSSFTMDSVRFSHIRSDAFDGDFTEGEVRNSVFEHLGNDGIDVSGSKLSFYNVRISGAGDKALSAGEYSIIEGRDLDISNSEIAIASKDNSIVTINRATITDSRLGVTLFQKKPEFGPASLEANDFVIRNTEVPSLIEEGSLFMMNGERIPANNKNVSELLYGNLYGTASK